MYRNIQLILKIKQIVFKPRNKNTGTKKDLPEIRPSPCSKQQILFKSYGYSKRIHDKEDLVQPRIPLKRQNSKY